MTLNEMKLASEIYTAYENDTMMNLVDELHDKYNAQFFTSNGKYAGIDLMYGNLVIEINTRTDGEVKKAMTGKTLYTLPNDITNALYYCGHNLFTTGNIENDMIVEI